MRASHLHLTYLHRDSVDEVNTPRVIHPAFRKTSCPGAAVLSDVMTWHCDVTRTHHSARAGTDTAPGRIRDAAGREKSCPRGSSPLVDV